MSARNMQIQVSLPTKTSSGAGTSANWTAELLTSVLLLLVALKSGFVPEVAAVALWVFA